MARRRFRRRRPTAQLSTEEVPFLHCTISALYADRDERKDYVWMGSLLRCDTRVPGGLDSRGAAVCGRGVSECREAARAFCGRYGNAPQQAGERRRPGDEAAGTATRFPVFDVDPS